MCTNEKNELRTFEMPSQMFTGLNDKNDMLRVPCSRTSKKRRNWHVLWDAIIVFVVLGNLRHFLKCFLEKF